MMTMNTDLKKAISNFRISAKELEDRVDEVISDTYSVPFDVQKAELSLADVKKWVAEVEAKFEIVKKWD